MKRLPLIGVVYFLELSYTEESLPVLPVTKVNSFKVFSVISKRIYYRISYFKKCILF